MALNGEIQEKARREVAKELDKHHGELSYDALMEMHYLETVILGQYSLSHCGISVSLLSVP